ncbi:hypothetical protein Bpfe_029954 [Biomphalaria pfeifferi]|uniref:Uncharacterized protein n=1 Tax=Biomphalaria pfeifferi TaxID=112525 RepID=A0AAD8EUQ9_BIOPF|nr:hypothetical protein Bpfe_029954 [Biomphalaria pfeifferi]
MSSGEIANTGPKNGRGRNNEFDFGSGIRENSILGKCMQAIDMNCICGVLRGQCSCQATQLHDLNLTEMCTSAHFSENDLNGGELIPGKPDVVVDEHYKDASWAYLTDEAKKDYVLETMVTRKKRDKTRQDKKRQDKKRQDKKRQDKKRQDKKRQDKKRQDKKRQDKKRQDKTRQEKKRQDKTRQDKKRQDKKRQDKKRQDKTRKDKTRQDKKRQDKTRQDKTRKETRK